MDGSVKHSPKGMTLLELILALFLFATLVPLFVGLWSTHHRAVEKSASVVLGNNICHLILEQAMAAGYSGVDSLAATTLADRTLSLQTTTTDSSTVPPSSWSNSKDYVWSMSVTAGPSTTPSLRSGEKLVNVKVEWTERSQKQTVQASTLLVDTP